MGKRAARLEHRQGAVEVDTHTQVEIGFGCRADHRREVKNTARAVIDDPGQGRTISNVTGGNVQTWISADGRLWR